MKFLRAFLLVFLFCGAALAAPPQQGSALAYATAPHFPELTGRVVDAAHVLSAPTVQQLDQMLADYENGTTNQVVVVTVPSLGSGTIEDYGYQLGRHWQIGQKDKNNGVLLIVAPHEHKVRIEVGYGLEPVLTDAASSEIVQQIILPPLREGQMDEGVLSGTKAILSVLGGKGIPQESEEGLHVSYRSHGGVKIDLSTFFSMLFFIFFIRFAFRHPFLAMLLMNSSSGASFGGSGSGGFGGGFSGGGGSFGGGGASGSW